MDTTRETLWVAMKNTLNNYTKMKNKWKWYIYELSDENGVFYVGKGTGDRIKTTQKQGSPQKLARCENCEANIVAYFKDESDAFAEEAERITWYKGLTNIAKNKASRESLAEFVLNEGRKVYPNVRFTGKFVKEREQIHKAVVNGYEKLSKEIKCHAVVNAQERVDLLAFLIRKLPRSVKPLSPKESRRLITCSL